MLLSAGNAAAGFGDVWWTEAGPGWTNATDRPVASNLVARQWTEVWTQTSSTNYIPAVDWIASYTYPYEMFWRRTEWSSDPDTGTQLEYLNSSATWWLGDLWYGSHIGPIGGTNTSSRTWTNVWIQMPRPDVTDARADLYSNYLLYSFYGLGAADGDGFRPAANVIWSNSTATVTTSFKVKAASAVVDSLYMTTHDAVAIDCYHALAERWAIVQGDHDQDRKGIRDYYKPMMGGVRRYPNLQVIKEFYVSLLPYYVDPYLTNDFTQAFGTNYASIAAWSTFAPTATGLCAAVGAPTNYLSYSAPNTYSLYPAEDQGRVVTNTYVMVCTSTNECTNTVYDFEHSSREIVGTNGQTVSLLSTNLNIQEGYMLSDYGWKYMPSLITNGLRWVGGAWTVTASSYAGGWSVGQSNATWSAAKANINQSNGWSQAVGSWTYGNTDGTNYYARTYSSAHTLGIASATNIEAEADVYVYADATPFVGEPFTWDDATYPAFAESRMALVTNGATSNSVWAVIVGSTNQPTWCADPPGDGTNGTGRGVRMNLGKQRTLYKYENYLDNE